MVRAIPRWRRHPTFPCDNTSRWILILPLKASITQRSSMAQDRMLFQGQVKEEEIVAPVASPTPSPESTAVPAAHAATTDTTEDWQDFIRRRGRRHIRPFRISLSNRLTVLAMIGDF